MKPSYRRTVIFGAIVAAMTLGCQKTSNSPSQSQPPLQRGEFGRAVEAGQPARNIQTFDVLDFDVFSNQKWDRLSESHADDIIVSWPDGHDTHGINQHIGFKEIVCPCPRHCNQDPSYPHR